MNWQASHIVVFGVNLAALEVSAFASISQERLFACLRRVRVEGSCFLTFSESNVVALDVLG